MRRFFYIFGLVMAVVVVAGAIGIGILVYKGSALDTESKAYVDQAVQAIASTWSKQQLLDRASPELRDKAKPPELDAMFDTLSRLGPLVAYEGATGQAQMSYTTGWGSNVWASYVAKARFQNGAATFHIGLVKRDGQWMIHNFHVDPAPGAEPTKRT
jgi:hypothetical protein